MGEEREIAVDTDGDGRPDMWGTDTDGDGKLDQYKIDTDGDGTPDVTLGDHQPT